jgi:hypothetical protein
MALWVPAVNPCWSEPWTTFSALQPQWRGLAQSAVVRADNLVHRCDQQVCARCCPTVMLSDHVHAVRLPLDHARFLLGAALPA